MGVCEQDSTSEEVKQALGHAPNLGFTYYTILIDLTSIEHVILNIIVIHENVTPPSEKLCHGRTRCIRLSHNDTNEEEFKFNDKGRVCSKNYSTFASLYGIVRKRTNAH